MKKRSRKTFFTLIEVVVVIVILMTLASIAVPTYMNYTKKANIGAAKSQVKLLVDALNGYRLDVGSYPDESYGLQCLIENLEEKEKWAGPYLSPKVPQDPWGNDYVYVCPGEHGDFDVYSYGADGEEGGEGENADITSWK